MVKKIFLGFVFLPIFLILPLGCSHPAHEHPKPHADAHVVSGPVPAQPVGVNKVDKHYCTSCGRYYKPKYHCKVCGVYYHGAHKHVCR